MFGKIRQKISDC